MPDTPYRMSVADAEPARRHNADSGAADDLLIDRSAQRASTFGPFRPASGTKPLPLGTTATAYGDGLAPARVGGAGDQAEPFGQANSLNLASGAFGDLVQDHDPSRDLEMGKSG